MNRINDTRFMTQEELASQLTAIDINSKEEIEAGGVPLLAKDGKVYVDTEDNHTIIFGATGSKKTRLLGMPSVEILSRAGESFMVTDPKGEIYEKTAASVSDRGYQIICLNLRDLTKGETWNPLLLPYDYYHNGEKGKAVEMISEISRMLAGHKADDPFWTNSTADVLAGFMLILMESASREECHIKSVLALWEQYLEKKSDFIKNIKNTYGNSLITRKISSIDNESNKTVGSIESLIVTALNRISANEEFVEFLSQDGMEFDTVTKQKTAIYLIIPDENKFYHFIASLFMEQLYEALIKEAQKHPQCKLGIRMNYIVDEFANIPTMQNMDSMITAARSRNIRFNLIVQSKMQLEDKYKAIASVICDNCSNWVYLYSKDYGLLSEISRLCGEVIYDNHMRMPLISEFDLQHLRKEDGEALVLAGRNYPCITNLPDIDVYPQMEANKKIPADCKVWEEPEVFRLNRINTKDRFAYIPKRGPWERMPLIPQKKADTWLVGTLNGMIMVEGLTTNKEIESGRAIIKMCMDEFKDWTGLFNMEWYVSVDKMQTGYYLMANRNPMRVFISLDDLGRERFTAVDKSVTDRLKGAGIW